MIITQPKFMDIVKTGRSLILVSTRSQHNRVRELMEEAYWSRPFIPENNLQRDSAISMFSDNLIMPNAQLLMFAQACNGGFHVSVDRVIWIGVPPLRITDANDMGTYELAMGRGDMPWGHPAKWHYSVDQLFN